MSNYFVRKPGESKILTGLSLLFIYTFFLIPQYCGIALAGFDFTVNRIILFLLYIIVLTNMVSSKKFLLMIKTSPIIVPVCLYCGVMLYTMVLRADISAFANGFIEFMFLFMLAFILKYVISFDQFALIVKRVLYFLCFHGFFEYFTRKNIFWHMKTMRATIGYASRSGSIRIMGPCGHALGYGLLLELLLPIACISIKKKNVDIIGNFFLIILTFANILFTGSRSSLVFFAFEFVVLCFMSPKKDRKNVFIFIIFSFIFLTIFTIIFRNTGVGRYILLQVTSVIDSALGTEYSIKYGAELNRLKNSSDYRDLLPKIFTLDYLNPLLGRGVSRTSLFRIDGVTIASIDNFYVSTYIKFAYPGLVSYVLFLIYVLKTGYAKMKEYKDNVFTVLLVGVIIYYANLWYVDTLQTLRYAYAFVAILLVYTPEWRDNLGKKNISKYLVGNKVSV